MSCVRAGGRDGTETSKVLQEVLADLKMFGLREGKVNRGEKKFTKKDIFRPKKANDINVVLLP